MPQQTALAMFTMETIVPDVEKRYADIFASVTGESEDRREDLASLGKNMLIAPLIIVVMLGAQLRSHVQPVIIMAVIPFGIIGAVLGHLLLGFDLSLISILGIVALTGVAINDSVVLINYYNRQRQGENKSSVDAVRRRFRPILLTTSFALLPMLLETSLQARFLIPMAISLAFGLLLAAVILPFLLPVLIRIAADASHPGIFFRRVRKNGRSGPEKASAHPLSPTNDGKERK